jgi:ataxia telangiectasia mutated family protein
LQFKSGNDDLRQDAVMAQVFQLCDTMLQDDRETKRRSLSVRSYKIIPLGLQAGVLEFVANTTPLQPWLMSAHVRYDLVVICSQHLTVSVCRYNKDDWTPKVASAAIQNAYKEHQTEPEKQLARYQETKKHFHPVLRHFFTEKHKTPMAWFEMRLNYIRSVATTSIVGHVLGLGDRHSSNILIDCETGEMVHIDLGIAFEQGKLLKVPELVPFRMTSDVVDGMGAAGTQGVFQRCAEETLRVLRESSEVIMTVLEVFKHDPLHSWTASEIKLKRVQKDADRTGGTKRGLPGMGIDMASGTADEAADRALTSVARKLDKAMSVEYTVNALLAEATDPMRLATIWYGK